ncbi:hypothetical protein E4U53_008008 [Claviceps sorghi]|nr:hypothetical protein E4U53_008008 [Claviceps sorghi]
MTDGKRSFRRMSGLVTLASDQKLGSNAAADSASEAEADADAEVEAEVEVEVGRKTKAKGYAQAFFARNPVRSLWPPVVDAKDQSNSSKETRARRAGECVPSNNGGAVRMTALGRTRSYSVG